MTEPLHADEVAIDAALVSRLLADQMPGLTGRTLRAVPAQGTDNVVFRLGPDLCVRLPRKPAAVRGLLIEREWLPRLGPHLPLEVPRPVAGGEPGPGYPFPWLVCTWLDGTLLAGRSLDAAGARALGEFVVALRSVAAGGPRVAAGERAGPLTAYDRIGAALDQTLGLQAAGRVESGLVDARRAWEVWRAGREAPDWPGPPVWVHRDLQGGNLLVRAGRLSGVLDFGGLAAGDPAGDVMAAFHALHAELRPLFRTVIGADDATWARGRAWALVQGLEALPYYLDSHPGMVTMARRVIAAALEG